MLREKKLWKSIQLEEAGEKARRHLEKRAGELEMEEAEAAREGVDYPDRRCD